MADSANPSRWKKVQRYRRVPVEMDVRISTIDPETDPASGEAYFRSSQETCANVSAGGAYVELEEAVSPGRRLLVELDLPDGRRVETVGRVAWTRAAVVGTPAAGAAQTQRPGRYAIGIEFLDASPQERRRLEEFLDAHGDRVSPATGAVARNMDGSRSGTPDVA